MNEFTVQRLCHHLRLWVCVVMEMRFIRHFPIRTAVLRWWIGMVCRHHHRHRHCRRRFAAAASGLIEFLTSVHNGCWDICIYVIAECGIWIKWKLLIWCGFWNECLFAAHNGRCVFVFARMYLTTTKCIKSAHNVLLFTIHFKLVRLCLCVTHIQNHVKTNISYS